VFSQRETTSKGLGFQTSRHVNVFFPAKVRIRFEQALYSASFIILLTYFLKWDAGWSKKGVVQQSSANSFKMYFLTGQSVWLKLKHNLNEVHFYTYCGNMHACKNINTSVMSKLSSDRLNFARKGHGTVARAHSYFADIPEGVRHVLIAVARSSRKLELLKYCKAH
jgi:hypothetical protein